MKLDDYYFQDKDKIPSLDIENLKGKNAVGVTNGIRKCTPAIVEYDKATNTIKTEYGFEYELGKMNPDYKEMLEAKTDEVPIVVKWSVCEEYIFDGEGDLNMPEDQYLKMLASSEIKPYKAKLLSGICIDGLPVAGEVVKQDGNFVTINWHKNRSERESERVFVCWISMRDETRLIINRLGRVAGIQRDNFAESFGEKCRPILVS